MKERVEEWCVWMVLVVSGGRGRSRDDWSHVTIVRMACMSCTAPAAAVPLAAALREVIGEGERFSVGLLQGNSTRL